MNRGRELAAIREALSSAWMAYVRALSDLGADHATTQVLKRTHATLLEHVGACSQDRPIRQPSSPDFGSLFAGFAGRGARV